MRRVELGALVSRERMPRVVPGGSRTAAERWPAARHALADFGGDLERRLRPAQSFSRAPAISSAPSGEP